MQNDRRSPQSESRSQPGPQSQSPSSWADRLAKTKVTPLVFLAFFALLAAMSGFAALVGYGVHKLSRPGVHEVRP